MPDQVDPEVAARRLELLVDLQSDVMDGYVRAGWARRWRSSARGSTMKWAASWAATYADSPDIDGHVFFTAAGDLPPAYLSTCD